MSKSHGKIQLGRFVQTPDGMGLGKVIGLENDICTVRFFKSVSDFVVRTYQPSKVERAYLHPQTRVYFCDRDGVWSIGRVIDFCLQQGDLSYTVRFPNNSIWDLRERDLQVRCLLPVEDPAAVLAGGGIETQYLHDRRRAALESLSKVRAASYGLTGLLSSSVELLPHQVDVVRRVLNDQVQRYLLADEVGLGKTIEAGSIIRQAILDNPGERVVVLAPTSLTGQWRRELSWRFSLKQDHHYLQVLPHDQLGNVDRSGIETLVIDEAHNLIPADPSADPSYQAIADLALRAHRLLLISATPVLGNERTLLALLHLLDPQTYRLEDEASFVDKVRNRQEFGRLLLALNPSQPPVFLRRTLGRLRRLLPAEDFVDQLVARIEVALSAGQGTDLVQEIRTLHRHIGDTYRIHQRLIRTRRRDLPEGVLPPRQAVLYRLEEDEDDRTPLLVDAIEQWRQRSVEALAGMSDGNRETFAWSMAIRNARLHEALGISVEACAQELRSQLSRIKEGYELSFDEDLETLEYALGQVDEYTEETRVNCAKSVVQRALQQLDRRITHARLVVFCSSADFVRTLADELEFDRTPNVFMILKDFNETEVLEAVDGFRSAPGPAVLLCDRRGEEGLNLQFAHGIVHVDLPLDPARVEQRIGRLDRLGRKFNSVQQIFQWAVAPYHEDVHPWLAWYELLRDGFKVFDKSMSEVQFLLDDLHERVLMAMYLRGAPGLRELSPEVADALTKERLRLDEQYALDSRAFDNRGWEDAFRAIERSDAPEQYDPIHTWLTRVLKFWHEPIASVPTAFSLLWTKQTLLPRVPWQEVIREVDLRQPMTYDRSKAAVHRELQLVRPGFRLLDSVEKVLRWDDRGTAFATWRSDPRWVGEGRGIWLGFRLTYVLQADVEQALQALEDSLGCFVAEFSLKRRMDAMLPPWICSMDVDIDLEPVTDPLLRDILALPYSNRYYRHGRQDYNLGSRREALYALIGYPELAQACHRARERSEELLRGSPEYRKWEAEDGRRAIAELVAETESLKRRQVVTLRETGRTDPGLERDIRVNEAMAASLRSPSVRLDSIGLFVVSNTCPSSL